MIEANAKAIHCKNRSHEFSRACSDVAISM